jgi:two-component system sensor histidine kinase DesK
MCRVTLGSHEVEVADDGVGPTASSSVSTGLAGLRERVESAGGGMSVGRSDLGGFSLRVTLGRVA